MNKEKYWLKSIGIANTFLNHYLYWYWQYFLQGLLVLSILLKSIVNNPAQSQHLQ